MLDDDDLRRVNEESRYHILWQKHITPMLVLTDYNVVRLRKYIESKIGELKLQIKWQESRGPLTMNGQTNNIYTDNDEIKYLKGCLEALYGPLEEMPLHIHDRFQPIAKRRLETGK